ncbi:SDR family oxidoreductase [Sphingomonas donggukensis]|uniref:SDR family oxidoreductase n=1 Tax=Sphingomonas donggukensis TaxID=2949093 RepID=A0ABY4TYN5_9SPHN|nr:SDR family oxidoreductase [Sphingomonas donggukensis]URW75418.1 SDR family oxidoreductase [Sphingomonas donggukensis]
MPAFTHRTILITGAASGIGLATAHHLAHAGAARLVLVDSDADALARIDLPCTLDLLPGDVRDEAFWDNAAAYLGDLDHAVVNAGVAGASGIADHDFAEWRRILSVNLDGAFLTLRAAMRAMKRRGGSIVATASATGIKPEPGTAAYGASKAALMHLVKVAAKEGAASNIRVNAVAPAGVETPVWDAVPMFAASAAEIGRDAAFAEIARAATPLGRFASADEIATQIAFLLSDNAALVTGTTLVSDGGYTL